MSEIKWFHNWNLFYICTCVFCVYKCIYVELGEKLFWVTQINRDQ